MTPETDEYRAFDNTMRKLIAVPHEKVKAALDEEKRRKKKRKPKRTSASDRASSGKD